MLSERIETRAQRVCRTKITIVPSRGNIDLLEAKYGTTSHV